MSIGHYKTYNVYLLLSMFYNGEHGPKAVLKCKHDILGLNKKSYPFIPEVCQQQRIFTTKSKTYT